MKRCYFLIILVLFVSSCGGHDTDESKAYMLLSKCTTAKEALEIVSAERYPEVPDTVFLDYYLTMPKTEAEALTEEYLKSGKLKKDKNSILFYQYNLDDSDAISMWVKWDYFEDKLAAVTLMYFNTLITQSRAEHCLARFETDLEPIFLKKGYFPIFQGFSKLFSGGEALKAMRIKNGIENPIYDPSTDPIFDGPSANYYHNNTVINLTNVGKMIPCIIFKDAIYYNALDAENEKAQTNDSVSSDF